MKQNDAITVAVEATPSALDRAWFQASVESRNLAYDLDPTMRSRPANTYFFVKDESGAKLGAALVFASFDQLSVVQIWIEDKSRGRGLGARLYGAIEDFARAQNYRRILLSTYEFQDSAGFWEKMGFVRFAELADYPKGARLLFYQKRI